MGQSAGVAERRTAECRERPGPPNAAPNAAPRRAERRALPNAVNATSRRAECRAAPPGLVRPAIDVRSWEPLW